MTAEIAIVNRAAIALAADSALTVGGKRVHKGTSKLFSLGPANDIAVMVYGNGLFCGQQWDSVIKSFRRDIGDCRFDSVEQCADSLLAFMGSDIFDIRRDPMSLAHSYGAYFVELLEDIAGGLDREVSKSAYFKQLRQRVATLMEEAEQDDELPNFMSLRAFSVEYMPFILDAAEAELAHKPSAAVMRELVKLTHFRLSRQTETSYHSGVVVAGFGDKEYFPCVCHYTIDGKMEFGFRHWKVGHHDSNAADGAKTAIMPFAQMDIFHLFMEGVSPDQVDFLEEMLTRVLNAKSDELVRTHVQDGSAIVVEKARQRRENDAAVEGFMRQFELYRQENVVRHILRVVENLPMEELADMALAMVELTGLRRKVDSHVETVGGPIDVAVISKGDGLVWMQRKAYFDKSLNPDFVKRKYAHLFGERT